MGAKIFAHIDLEIGIPLATTGDQRGEQVGCDGGNGPDRDSALQGWMIAQFFGGVFDFKKDAAGAFEENFTGFGQHGLAAQAVEEFSSDLGFQVYYLLAKRRLADVGAFGGTGEVARLGDRDDVTKLV